MSSTQNAYRLFNLDSVAERLSAFTVNVHDYQVLSPTVARVVLSYTGRVPTQDEIRSKISDLFQNNAAAIAGSFRSLTESGDVKSVVGFVKTSREVIPFDETATAGKYKAMASNLLMKKDDETMWEIKSGATGKYLAKQTGDDLRALVHLAHNSVSGLPRFNQIASLASMTQPKEFAAFVDLNAEEVFYGYVVASNDETLTIVAKETGELVEVSAAQLVQVQDLEGEDAVVAGTAMAKEVAADKGAMVEYYKKAYSYSPEYIQKIIDMIDQHSFA